MKPRGASIVTMLILALYDGHHGAPWATTTTPSCIIVLDSTAAGSLAASGNTTVTSNCNFAVNSTSPAAVALRGIASIALSDNSFIFIAGGFDLSGQAQLSPAPITHQTPVEDPLGSLSPPGVPSACDFVNVVINDVSTLSPGVYCGGIQVGGNAAVTLNPGIYILKGGGLTVRGDSTLIGSGVTFFNTGTTESYGPIIIGHSSMVQLSAPASGTLAGVIFFADRFISSSQTSSSQTTNVLGARVGSMVVGDLYFPTQTVSLENFTAGGCTRVIANQVGFGGDIQVNCP
jgi:hypothetical protein